MDNLVTIQLISGVTILCDAVFESSNSTWLVSNPIRPVVLDGRIVYTRMNPYSDSTEVYIKDSHVISVMPLHTAYIDVYNEAVRQTEEQLQKSIKEATGQEAQEWPDIEAHETIQ